MRSLVLLAAICAVSQFAHSQGGGAPSPQGQTESAQGASSAERAVQARHDKVVTKSKARAAKRASKAASAASQ